VAGLTTAGTRLVAIGVLSALMVILGNGACGKGSAKVGDPDRQHASVSTGTIRKQPSAYAPTDDPRIGIETLGPRVWNTIDVHEHVSDEFQAERLLKAMNRLGIRRTCLMGSTMFTLTLDRAYGFEGFKENNEAILRIKAKYPDRFCAFVTLDPLESGNLDRLQTYVRSGADGLKLYIGHGGATGKGPFHSMPIDDPRMEPIFAWAEQVQLPIVLHVNLEKFWTEMINVLQRHPYLRVDLPHFGLAKNTQERLNRLGLLLDSYPNLYTDVSAGYVSFQTDSFEVLAVNREGAKAFFEAHCDKIMFGADMVLDPRKTDNYILNTARSYMQFLESERWRYFQEPSRIMYGLSLGPETLRKVYEQAPRTFLLADEKGHLPDRRQGRPIVGSRPLRGP